MLFPTKISIGLGSFLIATSSFSAINTSNISDEHRVKNLLVSLSALQAVIDPVTGYFVEFDTESMAEKRQDIVFENAHNGYSKEYSVIEGGGIILTMDNASFSQMRVVRDKEGIIHTQCSTTQ